MELDTITDDTPREYQVNRNKSMKMRSTLNSCDGRSLNVAEL